MTRVVEGSHSFTCTPTRLSTNRMNRTCFLLSSQSWSSFTDPGEMEGLVGLDTQTRFNNYMPLSSVGGQRHTKQQIIYGLLDACRICVYWFGCICVLFSFCSPLSSLIVLKRGRGRVLLIISLVFRHPPAISAVTGANTESRIAVGANVYISIAL